MVRRAGFIAALLALNGCVFGGCCKLSELSSGESEVPEGATLGLSLAVQPFVRRPGEQPYQSDALIRVIRQTGLFTQVDQVGRVDHPDFVVRFEGGPKHDAMIPLFTLMTFGLFPTVWKEEYGVTFCIFKPDSPLEQTVVDYRRDATEFLGIFANFLLPFPGYHFADPEETREYADGLARHFWAMRESCFGVKGRVEE